MFTIAAKRSAAAANVLISTASRSRLRSRVPQLWYPHHCHRSGVYLEHTPVIRCFSVVSCATRLLNMQNGSNNCGSKEISSLGTDEIKRFLDSVDAFIFDCDGVIWHLDHIHPASPKFISLLRKMGKKTFFITNNSLFTHDAILAKFKRGGIEVPKDDLMFPAILLCDQLQKLNFKGKIEILGEQGLKGEVRARGYDVNDNELPSTLIKSEKEFLAGSTVTESVSAVVVDIDFNCNYVKVTRLIDILGKNPDCLFFSGAPDKHIPISPTLITAGPAYLLQVIKDLTGRTPQVLGKPSPGMFDVLKEKHSLDPARTVFVGDSLESDIRMAKSCNLRSILVLTGSTKRKNIPYDDPERRPDYISESISELLTYMEKV